MNSFSGVYSVTGRLLKRALFVLLWGSLLSQIALADKKKIAKDLQNGNLPPTFNVIVQQTQ